MATRAVRNYAHFKDCLSKHCLYRALSQVCTSKNRAMYDFKTTLLPQMLISKRSLYSRTSRITSSSCEFCNSLVYSILPNFCLKQQQSNYSTQAQRPRSRTHYYSVLNITPNATATQIKSAYYELSKVFHPDINKDPNAHARFSEISEAYEVLGNVRNRRLYDRGVLNPLRYKGEDDLDEFHKEEGFASRKRKPPTGHTSTYNFDEFYRQHYGESRKRQSENRAKYEAFMKELEGLESQRRANLVLVMMLLLLAVCLWGSAIASANVHKPLPSQKKRGD